MFDSVFNNCTSLNKISFPNISTVSFVNQRKVILNDYYETIFNILCEEETTEKKNEYLTLLKLNDKDYRRTVLQIKYDRGLANGKE